MINMVREFVLIIKLRLNINAYEHDPRRKASIYT
jgi:hypothetical protein